MEECIRVHDNKKVDNPMKPKDIDNWYYHIIKVALRSNNFEYYINGIWKQHISNQRESLSQSCSHTAMKTDYQIALIQTTQIDQTFTYLNTVLALSLTWIKFNHSMDK